jgi:hypothetical protein
MTSSYKRVSVNLDSATQYRSTVLARELTLSVSALVRVIIKEKYERYFLDEAAAPVNVTVRNKV